MNIATATSIKEKIAAIVRTATLASLLSAGGALMAFDLLRHLSEARQDVRTQADILALASQATVSFRDPKSADEDLSALRAKPTVAAAAIYDAQGELFVAWRQAGAAAMAPWKAPSQATQLTWRYVQALRPIQTDGEPIGWVLVTAEHQLLRRLLEYAGVLALVILGSLGLTQLLTNRLQRAVTEPILDISEVARKVLRGQTKALRATRRSNDEVGALVDAFNQMLAELNRRAERLQESNLAKDRFLATLAHELRNPLAPLRTGLEILKRDPTNGARSTSARATMERQLTHMVRLIDDLLDISRVNTGKFRLERAVISLAEILESAADACRPAFAAREQSFELRIDQPGAKVEGDAVRLTQAITNLLINANKYTQPGGHITAQMETGERTVAVTVQDNGIGLPPEAAGAIFGLFSQLGHGQSHTQGGLGIGLFLVRSIVELHGGSVTASSEGEGQGARFRIELPRADDAALSAGDHQRGKASDVHSPRRILVVDDNVDAAQTLASVLDMLGHATATAHDGPTALTLAPQFRPEAVILDIGMPGMDGHEVARRLRASPGGDALLLIAATGWGADVDKQRSVLAGFDQHLTKPVGIAAVESALADLDRRPGHWPMKEQPT
ncbi:MAG TPA: ATP-binding protein [Ramlibacter sp.]|nr:ATP-binding protein [Ramlibacter sp.]